MIQPENNEPNNKIKKRCSLLPWELIIGGVIAIMCIALGIWLAVSQPTTEQKRWEKHTKQWEGNKSEADKAAEPNTDAIILGCARDIEKYLPNTKTKLEMLKKQFRSAKIIIYENDSKDKTASILKSWEDEGFLTKFITEKNIAGERTERIANCRNELLEEARKDAYGGWTVMVMADLDDKIDALHERSVQSCFADSPFADQTGGNWAMCSANQTGLYYDSWALRTVDPDSCPEDCWVHETSSGPCDFPSRFYKVEVASGKDIKAGTLLEDLTRHQLKLTNGWFDTEHKEFISKQDAEERINEAGVDLKLPKEDISEQLSKKDVKLEWRDIPLDFKVGTEVMVADHQCTSGKIVEVKEGPKEMKFGSNYWGDAGIPFDSSPVPVKSAFGSLAVYKRDYVDGCRYKGTQDSSLRGLPWGEVQLCEHVDFNKCVVENGGKLYINPMMITNYTPENAIAEILEDAEKARGMVGWVVFALGLIMAVVLAFAAWRRFRSPAPASDDTTDVEAQA